jgi:2-polyprenyl-6-methoxyphenol hydroxylase-like FAD-dependent oxidoreductase
MDVIVVGGGIGGLSLALSLYQAGIKVRVYEAVSNPGPLGAGINLQPTAVRELTELGLGDELAQVGVAVQRLSLFSKFGQLISEEPRGLSAGYRWPQYAIHRGRLQQLLLRAVCNRIGEENVCTGFRLLGFEQDRDRVTATFHDIASEADITCSATILIGADGIHSTVRRTLYPDEGEPCFARQVLWRASVDAEPFLDGRTQIIAGHLHQRIIVYPMARASSTNLLTNWICQMTVAETSFPREDWSRRVSKEKLLASFGAWRFPWLNLPELIERTSEIFEFPLMDRDPIPSWTFGRVTVLGDAAHPMQPIGSQAGSQAIIDGRVLTGALASASDPTLALRRYDEERRPAMNEIVLRNRKFGPEASLQFVEERAPDGFDRIEDVISREELDGIIASFSSAAGIDVRAVNTRRSFIDSAQRTPSSACKSLSDRHSEAVDQFGPISHF